MPVLDNWSNTPYEIIQQIYGTFFVQYYQLSPLLTKLTSAFSLIFACCPEA